MITEDTRLLDEFVMNEFMRRTEILRNLFDERRDLDVEAGYPKHITPEMYKGMYLREGAGRRVVAIYPKECWRSVPVPYDEDEPNESDWEQQLDEIGKNLGGTQYFNQKNMLWHYLRRLDELSGVGRFGVMFYGLSDSKEFKEPVEGYGTDTVSNELLYLRVFDETLVDVKEKDKDRRSPRYGLPVKYTIKFGADGSDSQEVHWHRVRHFADNCMSSELYGEPRQQDVWNYLYNIRKVHAGSAEMFYLGGFPGHSFETKDGATLPPSAELRQQHDLYMQKLKRYFAFENMTVKSLSPQVADPTAHLELNLKLTAMTKEIPYRIFMGSEQAHQASTQDKSTWNERLGERRENNLSPRLVAPALNDLINLGVLSKPKGDKFSLYWPDLDQPTEQDKSAYAKSVVEVLAMYIEKEVYMLIPPQQFFTHFFSMDPEDVKVLISEALRFTGDGDGEPDGDAIPS